MKSRWYTLIVLMIAGALMLAACGAQPEEQQSSSASESSSSGEEAAPAASGPVSISMARFFGDCDDSTAGVTDVSQASTECEVIQILTNKFNAENENITVDRLGGSEWGTYYDALNTTFAGGSPPNVAVMHGSNLPDYAGRNLLRPVGDDLSSVGVDPDDWTAPARGAVTYEGNIYGVPFDLHASLWHINVDLFKEAGLVDDAGEPILPTSREEFMAQAQTMQEQTGKTYYALDATQFPPAVRLWLTLVWQQNSDVVGEDGTVSVDTPAGQEALSFISEMFENGYANSGFNYSAAQEAFLTGEVAILQNGTWVVDQYNREAPFEYIATNFPTLYETPAVWANSHIWTVPQGGDEAQYQASLEFLAFLNEHVRDWSLGTGHLAPRESVLNSAEFAEAPQRTNIADTANIAHLVPAVRNWQAVEDILKEELEATWLTGQTQEQALTQAQERISEQLGR